jgi:lysophospholipase L1-like esterase
LRGRVPGVTLAFAIAASLALASRPGTSFAASSPKADSTSLATASPRVIAVIGDSIFRGIRDDPTVAELTEATATTSWTIHAESGFGWGASFPNWPLSVVAGSWVIDQSKELSASHPATIVVELGTNDALRAAFAVAQQQSARADRIRGAVATNAARLLAVTRGKTGCTVLVTASTHPTTLFGAGLLYARQAALVNSTIRHVATRVGSHAVAVADWARESDGHHAAPDSPQNWFEPDGVHLDAVGQRALVALVRRTAHGCAPGTPSH